MKIWIRIFATLFISAVAFCVGFISTAAFFERWVVPELVKEYPHDGQIGLEVFVAASFGGCFFAVVAFLVGIIWTVKRFRRSPVI